MTAEVEAIYSKGLLTLRSTLPLLDGQKVRVVVLEETEPTLEARVAALHIAADRWLAQQPAAADPPAAPDYTPEEWAELDAEWDEVFAEIQRRTGDYSEDEISADGRNALQAVRRQSRRSAT